MLTLRCLFVLQPVRSEKVSVKDTMNKVENKAVKKPDTNPATAAKIRSSNSMEKPQPIQLPPSFKDSIFGKVITRATVQSK